MLIDIPMLQLHAALVIAELFACLINVRTASELHQLWVVCCELHMCAGTWTDVFIYGCIVHQLSRCGGIGRT